jgi:chromosome segregation ATPase
VSEPKRYAIRGFSAALVEEENGVFIRYEDYARLKAEVERLTNNCDYLDKKLDEELDKSAMLCGQVERLTKEREQMESHYDDDTQTIAELRKELADAQESKHILNETIARLMKGAKR